MSQFCLHITDNIKIHSFLLFSLQFTFNWNLFYISKCWMCSFLATYYLKLNESLLYRLYIRKNRVPYAEIQLDPWLKLLFSGWGWTWMVPQFTSCNSDFIRFVRYCKFTIARNKQTWKMHSPTPIFTPFSYLFLKYIFFLILCCSASTKPFCCWCNRKSFNTWLFLQMRLESVISKYFSDLKNACQLLQYFI